MNTPSDLNSATEQTDARILQCWRDTDESYPDKSTIWVASVVADYCSVDYGRVMDALERDAVKRGVLTKT